MKSRAALPARIEKTGAVYHGIRISAGSHLCVHAFVNATRNKIVFGCSSRFMWVASDFIL